MMNNKLISGFLIFIFQLSNIVAQTYYNPSEVPSPKLYGDGFVSDPEGLISDVTENEINVLATELREKKGYEIALVVLSSIDNKEPLPFATELGNLWKVGKGDRGIVVLVALSDRSMAIACGYEAEQYITDLISQEIIAEDILPYFQLNEYDNGVLRGVQVIRDIALDENVPAYVAEAKDRAANNFYFEIAALIVTIIFILMSFVLRSSLDTLMVFGVIILGVFIISFVCFQVLLKETYTQSVVWDVGIALGTIAVSVNTFRIINDSTKKIGAFALFFSLLVPLILSAFYLNDMAIVPIVYLSGATLLFVVFLIFFVIAIFTKDAYNKYKILQVFKLDVFGYIFPLPMFIVDLLVEKLLEKWRNQDRYSRSTGLVMRKLSESEEDAYLAKGQVTEEQIKSIDYDVWISDDPNDVFILKYIYWFSKYSTCVKCKFKTWYLVYDKVLSPATYNHSGSGEKKKACAHCAHQEIDRYVIPKKEQSSSSSSRGFSGGSFRGSSGGSFGGGSFGGGGSSGRW